MASVRLADRPHGHEADGRGVEVDADDLLGRQAAHLRPDDGAGVAALDGELLVAQAPHQLDERLADAHVVPARVPGGTREADARQRRDDHVERSARLAAVAAPGSVSGPIWSRNSTTEPGQPWMSSSGIAPGCFDLTWMKWMSWPSISVTKLGSCVERRLLLAPVERRRPAGPAPSSGPAPVRRSSDPRWSTARSFVRGARADRPASPGEHRMVNGLMVVVRVVVFMRPLWRRPPGPGIEQIRQNVRAAARWPTRTSAPGVWPVEPLQRARQVGLVGKTQVIHDIQDRPSALQQVHRLPGPEELLEPLGGDARGCAGNAAAPTAARRCALALRARGSRGRPRSAGPGARDGRPGPRRCRSWGSPGRRCPG